MKRCFIYSAGTFYGLRERPQPGDYQIAADAGLLLCQKLGIEPDLVIGDFDSMPQPENEPTVRVPVEKDDTDSMLAIREGLARGCTERPAAIASTIRWPIFNRWPSSGGTARAAISMTTTLSIPSSKTNI